MQLTQKKKTAHGPADRGGGGRTVCDNGGAAVYRAPDPAGNEYAGARCGVHRDGGVAEPGGGPAGRAEPGPRGLHVRGTVLRVSGGHRAAHHRPAAGRAPAGEYAGGRPDGGGLRTAGGTAGPAAAGRLSGYRDAGLRRDHQEHHHKPEHHRRRAGSGHLLHLRRGEGRFSPTARCWCC